MGGASILTPLRGTSASPCRAYLLRCGTRNCEAPREDAAGVCEPPHGLDGVEPEPVELDLELGPDPGRRIRIGEQNGAERDRRRPRGDELERVTSRRDPAHPDDRKGGRAATGEDG